MAIDNENRFVPEEDSREKNVKLFTKDAEKILDDQYNGMEIQDIVSCFEEEDVKYWNKLLNELAERIDYNKKTLSEKEIIVMKAKFIGEMTMYASLGQDRKDAKSYREMGK
jgi:hypothetical protein